MGGFFLPVSNSNDHALIIYEIEEGGTGVLKSLIHNSIRWEKFLKNMAGLLHLNEDFPYDEKADACQRACYNCLLGFWNQRHHRFITRTRILPLIHLFMASSVEKIVSDSSEHLDDLVDGGLDSALEERVLAMMQKLDIPLPSDVQFSITDKNGVLITVADYYYYKHKQLAVFVDGPPHKELQQEDERKQARRRSFGVYAMDFYTDITEGAPIPDELIRKRLLEFKEYLNIG